MLSGAIVSDSNGEQLKNLSTHNETLYEPTRVRNDILKENKNEISDVIKDENDNKNQIISRNENDLDNNTDEINQPLQVEDEAKDDNNSSIIDNRQLNNIEKQEEIIVEDDVAEIVIVDLNQLENQLNEEN
ncbi:hypothetical protein SDC9_200699 [bioreactor metagenome]|uniref:Uncharacterized protein n=1 Tax=bioreactor metagenome TaxID=1076179 RepID=A0A645IPN6_9ZZZZ